MIDREIATLKNNIDQLVNQAQNKLTELRSALNQAMVKPLLISKADAARGLRVYEAEGHIYFAFPFTYRLEGVVIKSKDGMELWQLEKPVIKERLWCELTTTISHRNGRNLLTTDRVQLFKDETLTTRFVHFHSMGNSDCSGSFKIPSITSIALVWFIKQGLQNAWKTIHFPDCPTLMPPDPDLKRLGQKLFTGSKKPSVTLLRRRLQKVASLVPPGWTVK